jgi:UDP-N-acetylmuramoyl-tripeptide--D-alanyl-D-alanine ligase
LAGARRARRDETLELIDESYNANPTSMAAALEVLAASQPVDGVGRTVKGRKIAILGDMLELGSQELSLHAGLAAIEAVKQVDLVHVAGPRMLALHEALPSGKRGEYHETSEALAARVHRLLDAGDVVMIKGSNGSRISLVAEAIKRLDKQPEAT